MTETAPVNRPDIFIVGTMKGGTTILHEFLGLHPEIHSGSKKEIHYFSLFEANGLDWYHDHFKDLPPGQHYLDASPTYFDMTNGKALPGRINAYNPEARVIMLAREPVERAVSHFNHLRKINKFPILQDMSADEFFSQDFELAFGQARPIDVYLNQCIDFSLYYRKALYYKAVFGNRFLMVHNEDLSQQPHDTMERIFRHIGVEPISSDQFNQRKYSHRGDGEGLPLSPTTIDRLNKVLGANYAAFRELAESSGRNAAPAREKAAVAAPPAPVTASVADPAAAPTPDGGAPAVKPVSSAEPAPEVAKAPVLALASVHKILNPAAPAMTRAVHVDHAFIITYGHAEGARVQSALNSVSGVRIRDGSGRIMAQLGQMAKGLDRARHQAAAGAAPVRSDADSVLTLAQAGQADPAASPTPQEHILGFTDTRHPMPEPEFIAYCDDLLARHPRSLLIFNARRTGDETVIQANRQFHAYATAHPDRCIEIFCDDYMADETALQPLFDRLGLPFDAAKIRDILLDVRNGVLVGKNNWLFLWDGSNQVHRYYTEAEFFPDQDEQAWVDLLTTRQDRVQALGAVYRHLTVPDKLSVLPELAGVPMPHFDRHPARRIAARLPGDGLNVDILPDLRAASEQAPVFYRTDSHWNSFGCQVAYRRLCAALGATPRDFPDSKISGRVRAMDLGGKLTPPMHEDVRFVTVQANARRVSENEQVRYNEETGLSGGTPRFVGCYTHLHNDSPDARPETVLLFGDSFSEFRPHLLTAMLAETYRDLHFVWSTNLDYDLIAQIRPQIVISEIAERFMGTVPTDEFKVTLD
ncbi:MAG: sulfotransferase [Paracoccus sp. (in: a-proteobacteria)]